MRVVINQASTLGPRTGIGHYTAELLRCLRQHADATIDAYPRGWLRPALRSCVRASASLRPRGLPRGCNSSATPSFLGTLRRHTFEGLRQCGWASIALGFRATCALRRYDLYHEPNFIPLPSDLPTLVTLHDLSVLLHPEWHPADRVAYFEKRFHRELHRCRHFLAGSEFTRQEIIRQLNVPAERVTRIYHGVRRRLTPLPAEQVAQTLSRLGLPAQYLLYLGTIEPRKNVLMLLRAYCALPAKLRARWPLLLVGGWGWNTGEVANFLQAEARQRGVIHVGYVADRHLAALYNGARALVYPSHYEGFGLPPVEMLACGGAVLASTAGAVAETVGGQAQLIDPEDSDGWRDAMARVLRDDDWWEELRLGAVEAARPYTWERCAADTIRVYRSLCGKSLPLDCSAEPAHRAAG